MENMKIGFKINGLEPNPKSRNKFEPLRRRVAIPIEYFFILPGIDTSGFEGELYIRKRSHSAPIVIPAESSLPTDDIGSPMVRYAFHPDLGKI